MGVLIHQIVEICYFPLQAGFIVYWEHFQQVGPLHVCLKAHYVLYVFCVVASEQDLAIVLILYKHLHRRFYKDSHCDAVRFSCCLQVVQYMALVIFWNIIICRCSKER